MTDAEAQRLKRAFRQATDRKLLDRLQIVRLAHRGRKHHEIAADLGITPRTVQRWLNAYLRGGLDGLAPRKAKGHAPSIPADRAEEIRRRVIDGPSGQGVDRANWTHAEPAVIDSAPWHRGKSIDEALAEHTHLEFERLPSYSPQLNVLERFRKLLLRRRATHNRLFEGPASLKKSLRAGLCYSQTVRGRLRSLIAGCCGDPSNRKASAGS